MGRKLVCIKITVVLLLKRKKSLVYGQMLSLFSHRDISTSFHLKIRSELINLQSLHQGEFEPELGEVPEAFFGLYCY